MHDLMLETAPGADVHAGLKASIASVAWTATTSTVAVGFGLSAGSVVLTAFGAVGLFDMAGSIVLVAHFRHALHHQEVSPRREHIAHLVVAYGMLTVGVATVIGSGIRLAGNAHTNEPIAGLVASAASIVALAYLGTRKRAIGRRIPSRALVTDGWLSLTGCATALCAVAGLVLHNAFGWTWVDPVAALCVAVVAIGVAATSLRTPGQR